MTPTKKYWLRGGVIIALIAFTLSFFSALENDILYCGSIIYSMTLEPIPFLEFLDYDPIENIVIRVLPALLLSPLGMIIGFIYGKIKSR